MAAEETTRTERGGEPEAVERARRYERGSLWLGLINAGAVAVALVVFLLSGASVWLRDAVADISGNVWVQVALFTIVIVTVWSAITLPWDYVTAFRREHRYGLSTQSLGGWLADNVLVIVSGRLAASGDFHAIRRLMTDRPHSIMLRSSDDRRLAADLIGQPSVFGVEIGDGSVMVRCSDLEAFSHEMPRVARESGVSIFEMSPTDESLESVFSYLVQR